MLPILHRLETKLETWISHRAVCLWVYGMGVTTIGIHVADWEAWTSKEAIMWGLLFCLLTSTLARSFATLARARQVGGEAAIELERAATGLVLHPFLAVFIVSISL